MCANLVAAGYSVTAGDACAELERAVRQCGARWRATLAEIAADADSLITMLPGSREVREAMAGSSVLAAMPSTAVWVDMTSSSPAAVRELTAAARARGVGVLDAPVGGGVPAARAGTLQVFVGGDAAVLDRCRLVLEALADPQRIIHVGGNGAGYTAKLLVNLLWFGQAVATGEALLLARRAGIDLDVLRQTLATNAASTAFVRDDLGALLDGDYLMSFGLDRCCEELTAIRGPRPRTPRAISADAGRRANLPAGTSPLRASRRRTTGGGPPGGRGRTPAPARPSLRLTAKAPQIDPGHIFAASYEAIVEADAVLTDPGHHVRPE